MVNPWILIKQKAHKSKTRKSSAAGLAIPSRRHFPIDPGRRDLNIYGSAPHVSPFGAAWWKRLSAMNGYRYRDFGKLVDPSSRTPKIQIDHLTTSNLPDLETYACVVKLPINPADFIRQGGERLYFQKNRIPDETWQSNT